jgi:hypothetical protein
VKEVTKKRENINANVCSCANVTIRQIDACFFVRMCYNKARERTACQAVSVIHNYNGKK